VPNVGCFELIDIIHAEMSKNEKDPRQEIEPTVVTPFDYLWNLSSRKNRRYRISGDFNIHIRKYDENLERHFPKSVCVSFYPYDEAFSGIARINGNRTETYQVTHDGVRLVSRSDDLQTPMMIKYDRQPMLWEDEERARQQQGLAIDIATYVSEQLLRAGLLTTGSTFAYGKEPIPQVFTEGLADINLDPSRE